MQEIRIKQETLPLWKQAPPSGHRFPDLPPRNSNRIMDPIEYDQRFKTCPQDFRTIHSTDFLMKNVILKEIEELPSLWQGTNVQARKKLYPIAACGVYSRTGVLVSVKEIQRIYKSARRSLKTQLQRGIIEKGHGGEKLEKYLWRNELYASIRFHRSCTQEWEAKKRKIMFQDSAGNNIVFTVEDDEDVPFDHFESHDDDDTNSTESNNMPEENPIPAPQPALFNENQANGNHRNVGIKREPADILEEPMAPPLKTPRQQPIRHLPEFQEHVYHPNMNQYFQEEQVQYQQPPIFPDRMGGAMNYQMPSTSTVPQRNQDVEYLIRMVQRINDEQPEKTTILRQCLLQIMMAFDRKDYDSMGPIFTDLARIFKPPN